MKKSYYQMLDIEPTATKKEIKERINQLTIETNEAYKSGIINDEQYKKINNFINKVSETLLNSKNRKKYNKNLNIKNKSNNNKKLIIAITSIGAAVTLAATGFALKKNKDFKEIIPNGTIGYFTSDNRTASDKKLEQIKSQEAYMIIEIPNYLEEINEKSKFYSNIEKCIENGIDFGFYVDTPATNEDQVKAEIYRINALLNKYEFTYPIIINFSNFDNMSEFEIISLTNQFYNELRELGYLFSLNLDVDKYELLKDSLPSNIRVHLQSGNENTDSYNTDFKVYNSGPFGWLGSSSYDGLLSTITYTSENFNNISVRDEKIGRTNYIGVDLSNHNGKVNFDELNKYIDYSIIRICDFKNIHNEEDKTFEEILDSQFERNLSECRRLNIPFGIYYYTRATNSEEAIEEANLIINYLNSKNIDFEDVPIFIDVESYNNADVKNMLEVKDDRLIDVINSAYKVFKDNNCDYYLYISLSDLKNLSNIEGASSMLDDIPVWLARYADCKNVNNSIVPRDFSLEHNVNEYGEIIGYKVGELSEVPSGANVVMLQITSNGVDSGFDLANGAIDINITNGAIKQFIPKEEYKVLEKNPCN